MRTGRFFWKLFIGATGLLALAILSSVALILAEFDKFYLDDVSAQLRSYAMGLAERFGDDVDLPGAHDLDAVAKEFGAGGLDGIRITFIAANGTVLGDTEAMPATMESHADRPEVRQAFREGWGESTRRSSTVSRALKYVALRVGPDSAPRGVIRASMPVRTIGERSQSTRRLAWRIAVTAIVAAACLALGLAKLWAQPIARITAAARSLSRGDLSSRIEVTGRDETALLARSLNRMRERLAAQLETIDHQRRTFESFVSQLSEGAIVADADGRIILANPEARRMLRLGDPSDGKAGVGPAVEAYVPQPVLQRLLQPSSEHTPDIEEADLQIDGPEGTMSVLARASDIALPRLDSTRESEVAAPPIGRLVVLTDVTELARTIQIKTDFAANASHELRTPLSAIRAAVETLHSLDAIRDAPDAANFIEVIERHSVRMEEMVGDLLELSRVESSRSRSDSLMLRTAEVFEDLRAGYSHAASDKAISLHIAIEAGAESFLANPQLLKLALGNVIDNAIRYTDQRGTVELSARRDDEAIAIEVADDGCGIPPEDQARVFERFYQVRRSRSGARRGTGLGLSIVKHAVAAMGGTVELTSTVGAGTRVTVTIPPPERSDKPSS